MATYFTVKLWIDYYIPLICLGLVILAYIGMRIISKIDRFRGSRENRRNRSDKNG